MNSGDSIRVVHPLFQEEDAIAPNDPMEECVAYVYDELGDYELISQPIAFRKLLVLLQVKFQI